MLLKFRRFDKCVFRFWFLAQPFGSEGARAGLYRWENLISHGAKKSVGSQVIVSSLFFRLIRGWTGASEKRVQDNLCVHAQNELIKNYEFPAVSTNDTCVKSRVHGKLYFYNNCMCGRWRGAWARALSSPSRCFQLTANLDKDFFLYLW